MNAYNFLVHAMIDMYGSPYYATTKEAHLNIKLEDGKFSHMEWIRSMWPGMYSVHYIVDDGGILCADCANQEIMRTLDADDSQFHIVGAGVNFEDPDLACDHCHAEIPGEFL